MSKTTRRYKEVFHYWNGHPEGDYEYSYAVLYRTSEKRMPWYIEDINGGGIVWKEYLTDELAREWLGEIAFEFGSSEALAVFNEYFSGEYQEEG